MQLYVSPPEPDGFVAIQQLAGFDRVTLEAGACVSVRIDFSEHAFSVFDVRAGQWRQRGGTCSIRVGASSRDIRLEAPLEVEGEDFELAYDRCALPHYFSGAVQAVSEAEFGVLLGRTPPAQFWDKAQPITRDSIIAELDGRHGFAGSCASTINAVASMLRVAGKPILANNMNFILDMPLRTLPRFSGGAFSEPALDGLIDMFNGRGFKGLATVLKETGHTKK